MFGGEVLPINRRIDCTHGVGLVFHIVIRETAKSENSTCDWPPQASGPDPERRAWYTVPMEFMESMFQKSSWKSTRCKLLNIDQPWKIPRTGAVSLYINSFTTMLWSEQMRTANEETAEQMAVEKAQPAHKKRLTNAYAAKEQRPLEKTIMEENIAKVQQPNTTPTEAEEVAKQKLVFYFPPLTEDLSDLRHALSLLSSILAIICFSGIDSPYMHFAPILCGQKFSGIDRKNVADSAQLNRVLKMYDSLPHHNPKEEQAHVPKTSEDSSLVPKVKSSRILQKYNRPDRARGIRASWERRRLSKSTTTEESHISSSSEPEAGVGAVSKEGPKTIQTSTKGL